MWIFAHIITFLHRRFVHIHTFFCSKMMCGCRLITCLYDIQQTSYERRLHHSHVAPSVPIWAEFIFALVRYVHGQFEPPRTSKATIFVCAARPYYIYAHICRGKWWCCNPHTRTWENPARFFRANPLYVLYIAGKNVKNCKVRSCLCALDPSIFHFIWVKHGGKIWQLEPSNRICKKM